MSVGIGFAPGRRAVLAVALVVMAACSGGDDAATAVVEPRVLCIDDYDLAYLSYTTSGDSTVELPLGDANVVLDPDGTAQLGDRPTVFAPGEQQLVAFWVEVGSTWTLGAGDQTRSVVASADAAPSCPDGPVLDPPDERAGSIVSDVDFTTDADGRVDSATVTVSYEGLGESRCPSGPVAWTPEPVEVIFDRGLPPDADDQGPPSRSPSPLVVTVDDLETEDEFLGRGYERLSFAIEATDVCTDPDGNRHRSWVASPAGTDATFFYADRCFGVIETEDGEVYDAVDCRLLPATDGIRIRLP